MSRPPSRRRPPRRTPRRPCLERLESRTLLAGGLLAGHTLGTACGLGYVRGDVPGGRSFEVACLNGPVGAIVSDEPFYDPANERLRS